MQWKYAALVASLALPAIVGCGQAPSAFDLQGAEASVRTALETWQNGEPATSLSAASPPIEIHDEDWKAGATLIRFDVTKTFAQPDGARCSVTLTVKPARGKEETKEATYHVKTDTKVVIARDPYL